MTPAVDVATLSPAAQRILAPDGPAPLRQMAARGIAPGLKPGDAITVVAILSEAADEALATLAKTTLGKLPTPVLNGALSGDLPAGVIDIVAPFYATNVSIMERMLALPSIAPDTVAKVAKLGSEMVCELVATNDQRLLDHPQIIEALYMNKETRMSTADRIIELAVRNKLELKGIPAFREAALAIQNELIAEPTAEATHDDKLFKECQETAELVELDDEEDTHLLNPETGEEEPQEKVRQLVGVWAQLTGSQKVRLVNVGSVGVRSNDEDNPNATEKFRAKGSTLFLIAVRDPNPIVAGAAIKMPGLNENDIERVSRMPVSQDVLRIISRTGEWTKSHTVKVNLVRNPRTPFVFATQWLMHLRDNELKDVAKNKNVPQGVQLAAKQQLLRRAKGKT
jgi:hypothetical protein